MEEYSNIETKVFRGCGFMTVSKYNNSGSQIYIADKDSKIITSVETIGYSISGTFEAHKGVIWNLDVSKDDNILISSSGDLSICFFDTLNYKLIHQINERNIPKFVCTQKKNLKTNLVAIICEALTKKSTTCISVYDLNLIGTGDDFKERIRLVWNRTSKPNVLLWLDETTLIVGCDDGKIVLRNIDDLDGSNETEYQFHNDSIKSLVWNKTFTGILTGSMDCDSKHINTTTWNVTNTYKSTVPINWACWNHNDRKVFLGGGIEAMNVAKTSNNDLNIKIYRTSDCKLTNHICSHFGPIRYIDKSPCNKNFVTASQDGTVKIYFINDDNSGQEAKQTKQIEQIEQIEQTKQTEQTEQIEQVEQVEIQEKNLENENLELVYLTNETNKMLNLSWKPPKQNSNTNNQVQKRIPGMPIPKEVNQNKNTDAFKISDLNDDLEKKLEQAKKEAEEKNSTIRVTNLPTDIRPRDLLDLFDLYGRIEERGGIKIKQYENETMAFIKYIYPESALKAIDNMNGFPLEYYIIGVELARQK
jgi:WD40 repeat protein